MGRGGGEERACVPSSALPFVPRKARSHGGGGRAPALPCRLRAHGAALRSQPPASYFPCQVRARSRPVGAVALPGGGLPERGLPGLRIPLPGPGRAAEPPPSAPRNLCSLLGAHRTAPSRGSRCPRTTPPPPFAPLPPIPARRKAPRSKGRRSPVPVGASGRRAALRPPSPGFTKAHREAKGNHPDARTPRAAGSPGSRALWAQCMTTSRLRAKDLCPLPLRGSAEGRSAPRRGTRGSRSRPRAAGRAAVRGRDRRIAPRVAPRRPSAPRAAPPGPRTAAQR